MPARRRKAVSHRTKAKTKHYKRRAARTLVTATATIRRARTSCRGTKTSRKTRVRRRKTGRKGKKRSKRATKK